MVFGSRRSATLVHLVIGIGATNACTARHSVACVLDLWLLEYVFCESGTRRMRDAIRWVVEHFLVVITAYTYI